MGEAGVVITLKPIDGSDCWETDVAIDGEWVGGGTGPRFASALDVAMDILYGDDNDHLNGDYGALARAGIK